MAWCMNNIWKTCFQPVEPRQTLLKLYMKKLIFSSKQPGGGGHFDPQLHNEYILKNDTHNLLMNPAKLA